MDNAQDKSCKLYLKNLDVANIKKNRKAKDGVLVYGMWKGVRVGVICKCPQLSI